MKDDSTIREKYGPAMEIQTQEEADAYFEECVQQMIRRSGKTRAEAETTERANLGYYAGYYDNETRERVERLYHCSHPVFGAIAKNGPPTAQEALSVGRKLARQST